MCVQQKFTQHCKSTILQFKIKKRIDLCVWFKDLILLFSIWILQWYSTFCWKGHFLFITKLLYICDKSSLHISKKNKKYHKQMILHIFFFTECKISKILWCFTIFKSFTHIISYNPIIALSSLPLHCPSPPPLHSGNH